MLDRIFAVAFAAVCVVSAPAAHAQANVEKAAQLAAAGDPQAQFKLAQSYQFGIGVKKDLETAAHWHREAAAQGWADSMYELGNLEYTLLKPADRTQPAPPEANEKSIYWFRKAAGTGHAVGQHTLGLMYAFGDRVPQDRVTGRMWILVAEANGHDGVKTLRERMEKAMTPDQMEESERRAEACLASHYAECD